MYTTHTQDTRMRRALGSPETGIKDIGSTIAGDGTPPFMAPKDLPNGTTWAGGRW